MYNHLMSDLNGILLIDKHKTWTSFDVVAKVRGTIKRATGQKIKVGHTGTLDPNATGLLVLAIGKATKQIDGLMKQDKIYEAELTLGKSSDTDDSDGELSQVSDLVPALEEIETALETFIGEIQQIPPAYSAIKVDGKRAYKVAREGRKVVIVPRTVKIKSINDVKYEYPILSFVTDVGSGTYIRSIARDLGETLGTGAYLSNLRRLSVGDYSVQSALPIDKLNMESIQSNINTLA